VKKRFLPFRLRLSIRFFFWPRTKTDAKPQAEKIPLFTSAFCGSTFCGSLFLRRFALLSSFLALRSFFAVF
jgi:hypothetical protein